MKTNEVPQSNIHAARFENLKARWIAGCAVQTIRSTASRYGDLVYPAPPYFVDIIRQISGLRRPAGQPLGKRKVDRRGKISQYFFATCKNLLTGLQNHCNMQRVNDHL